MGVLCLGGEEVVIGLIDGGEVVVPLLRDVTNGKDLDPRITHQPLPKLPNFGVRCRAAGPLDRFAPL